MDKKHTDHAIAFLMGEVHALFLFCQAAANAHPNPSALAFHLGEASLAGQASIEASPVPEATLEGYQYVMDGLKKLMPKPPGRGTSRHR